MDRTVGCVTVELVGGPMAGDQLRLSAAGSVGPPQQLCYLTSVAGQAAWEVYEKATVGAWPEYDEDWKYEFVGIYSLGKGELVKSP